MHVCVRLFGTLPRHYPGDYPHSGLDVEIWQDISVAELVELLQLSSKHVAIVSINGRLAKASDVVPDGAEVKFFQALSGG
jgi:sulfur carrier protein ThiS